MKKVCEYPGCPRLARYLNSWENKNGKHFGFVCATHDREFGRVNLFKIGMPTQEAILFERYLKETVDLMMYPDWPEWLNRYTHKHGNRIDVTEVKELNLSPRTFNALNRHLIVTIDELGDLSVEELMKIRMIGVGGVTEIQKALKDYESG